MRNFKRNRPSVEHHNGLTNEAEEIRDDCAHAQFPGIGMKLTKKQAFWCCLIIYLQPNKIDPIRPRILAVLLIVKVLQYSFSYTLTVYAHNCPDKEVFLNIATTVVKSNSSENYHVSKADNRLEATDHD